MCDLDRSESSSNPKTSTPRLALRRLGEFPHRLLSGIEITWDQAFPSEGLLAAGKNANQGHRDTRQRGVLEASGTVHPGVPIVPVRSPRANRAICLRRSRPSGSQSLPRPFHACARSVCWWAMKLLIRWIITGFSLFVAAWIVPGIRVTGDGWTVFAVMAVILGLVNAIVRPVLKLLSCPLIIVTLGLFVLVINGITLWLASAL